MIPRYKEPAGAGQDANKTEFTTRHATMAEVFEATATEAIILVMKIGWNENEDRPTARHATPGRFIEFLRTRDPNGVLRNFVADELETLAKHWRSGDVLKDTEGAHKDGEHS